MSKRERLQHAATSHFVHLNALHILNDGYQATFILLLPFIAKSQGLELTKVGFLGTLLDFAGVLLAVPAGYIAARIGGIKTLIIALAIYAGALVGVGMTNHFMGLVLLYGLAGVGFGVFHPIAFALLAKWVPKERRGRVVGNFTALGDVGRAAITAALSFLAVGIGWQKTALLYAGVALIIAVASYRLLFKRTDVIAPKEHPSTPMTLWQVVKNLRFCLAVIAGTIDTFSSNSLFLFLPFLLLKRGIDPALLGTFAAVFLIGNFIGKSTLGRLIDVFGNARVFIVTELLMALFIFLLANIPSFVVIAVCALMLGIFTKGTTPIRQSMIAESVEHHGNYEKAFGVAMIFTTAGATIAPIALGFLSDHHGVFTAFNVMSVVAVAATIPALLFSIAGRLQPKA